jgi:hypothetical protein
LSVIAQEYPELFVAGGPRGSLLADVAAITNLLPQLPCERCGKPLGVTGSARLHDDCVNERRSDATREWWDDLREDSEALQEFIRRRTEARTTGYDDLAALGKARWQNAKEQRDAYCAEYDVVGVPAAAEMFGVEPQTAHRYIRERLEHRDVAFGPLHCLFARRTDVEKLAKQLRTERRTGEHQPPEHFYRGSQQPLWRRGDVEAWAGWPASERSDELLTRRQIEHVLGVSVSRIRRAERVGTFPAAVSAEIRSQYVDPLAKRRWGGRRGGRRAAAKAQAAGTIGRRETELDQATLARITELEARGWGRPAIVRDTGAPDRAVRRELDRLRDARLTAQTRPAT